MTVSSAAFFCILGVYGKGSVHQDDFCHETAAPCDCIFYARRLYSPYQGQGGRGMYVYLDGVILLNFTIDFLLLLGTNRLCGYTGNAGKIALGAAVGGVYAGACLLPGFGFLGNFLWRTVCLCGMCAIAFGTSVHTLRRSVLFLLLSMAMGGLALGMGQKGVWSVISSAVGVFLLCALGFRGKIQANRYVPVELSYGEKHLCITALQDTGNTLRDPVTGSSVLVIGSEVAQKLTGLTEKQLKTPVESLNAIPGLRLIPYQAIGQKGGLLLALRIPKVKIGTWQGSSVVAFAPEGLPETGPYQALTGGVL